MDDDSIEDDYFDDEEEQNCAPGNGQQNLFGQLAVESTSKKGKGQKVEIIIKPNCGPYSDSVPDKGGKYFTSVDYSGRTYSGCSPCDSEEQIQNSVKWAKETINDAGDIPIVLDMRQVVVLNGGEGTIFCDRCHSAIRRVDLGNGDYEDMCECDGLYLRSVRVDDDTCQRRRQNAD